MKKHIDYARWLPAILWMAVIFFLSHQGAGSSSTLSSGITKTIHDLITTLLPWLDLDLDFFHVLVRKGAHFTAYLILGLLVSYARRPEGPKSYGSVFLFCMLYAMSDEFHQTFIPGRSGELRDVLIDSAGALSGILFYLSLTFQRARIRVRESSQKSA